MADHRATTALTLSHHHFLDPQVLRHLLKTPRALEDVVGDLVPASHRHTDDVFAPALAESIEVVLGAYPGIAHKDATAQFPPLQIVFDWRHGGDIHGMARKHPVTHRQTIAGHRQPDHNLWGIGTAIFRHAPFAWRLVDFGTCRHAAFHQIIVPVTLIDPVD